MQREKGSVKALHLSLLIFSFSLLMLISASVESLATDLEPNSSATLADMVREAERQATKPAEIAEPDRRRAEPREPVSFLTSLSKIVTGLQGDLNEAMTATVAATLGEYLADPAPAVAGAEDLARVPPGEAVVDRGQAEQLTLEFAPVFAVVAPASSETVTLSELFRPSLPLADDMPLADDLPPADEGRVQRVTDQASLETIATLEPPKPQDQATGLSLADMASGARPDQQPRALEPARTFSLSQLAAASSRTRPVLRLPSSLTRKRWIGVKPSRALTFPDPRRIGQGPVGRDKTMKYPASASLARFLGGIDSPPQNTSGARRGAARLVPVSLDQVRRKVDWDRASGRGTGKRYRVTGFSLPKEAFAGHRMTQQRDSEGRREEVMRELRQAFSPLYR